MFEVGVGAQFEAAHRLHGDFGPATRLHGHTYRVEVVVRGGRLQADGTLYNIAALQEALDGIISRVHMQNLDDVPLFAGKNTSAEIVAQALWEELAPHLSGLDSLLVRVWESPGAWAAYDHALP